MRPVTRAAPATDLTNGCLLDGEEHGQLLAPLIDQLASMHQDEGVAIARGDHSAAHDRFSEA